VWVKFQVKDPLGDLVDAGFFLHVMTLVVEVEVEVKGR
jgi:hypothetical protein